MKFIYSVALTCFVSIWQPASSQIITTIAGDGSMTNGPDGIAATAGGVYITQAIAVDKAGNVYTEAGSRLRKIDPGGVIHTVAGTGVFGYTGDGGPATLAKLTSCSGIICDTSGHTYISAGPSVRKINAVGSIATSAGTAAGPGYSGDGGPALSAHMNGPAEMAFDDAGNLYIAEVANHCIRKVSTSGIISTVAGTGIAGYTSDGVAATAAQIRGPSGLAIDRYNNIYFTEPGNFRIRKVDAASGILRTLAGSGPVYPITGTYTGAGGPATSATFLSVVALAVDNIGNVYASGGADNIIHKINVTGAINTYAGMGAAGFSGDGGPALSATLNSPWGIDIDDTGNIYFADRSNSRVRKISTGNHLPVFAGGHMQTTSVCRDSVKNINSLLDITDADAGQPLSWTLMNAPLHGTSTATYSATSTGSTVSVAGLSYTPTTGYTGSDTFRVRVDDGISADFTTVCVTIDTVGCSSVGIQSTARSQNGMNIRPNPNNGIAKLYLSSAVTEDARLVITDVTSRKVKELRVTTNKDTDIFLDLKNGVYFLLVTTEETQYFSRLVISK